LSTGESAVGPPNYGALATGGPSIQSPPPDGDPDLGRKALETGLFCLSTQGVPGRIWNCNRLHQISLAAGRKSFGTGWIGWRTGAGGVCFSTNLPSCVIHVDRQNASSGPANRDLAGDMFRRPKVTPSTRSAGMTVAEC
jgi:hypothetical protein